MQMLTPMTINFLIVDDDSRVLLNVVKDLRASNFNGKIFTANSVMEARKIIEKEKIDFFILDYHMPQLTGKDLLVELRDDIVNKNKPIMMLSSENDREAVMSCISHGASNYLLKPWNLEGLLSRINSCWKRYEMKRKAS